MGNCIYYCDKHRELTYKNREHIISSAIGGHRTLDRGYVSDQANNFLSKYELACTRYSPLFIERATLGPGKRGTFNIDKIDDPDVLSLEPTERDNSSYTCPLGFLFLGKAHIIPQFVVVYDDDLRYFNVIYLKPNYPSFSDITGLDCDDQIHNLLLLDKLKYKEVPVPYDTRQYFSCVGQYKKKWFFCSTIPHASFRKTLQQILQRKPLIQSPRTYIGFSPNVHEFRYTRGIQLENLSPIFIHAKNCFNTLAFFRGNEFVRQKMFDQCRECILTNSDWGNVLVQTTQVPSNLSRWLMETVHKNEHVVALYVQSTDVMAFSVLYGKSFGLFKLGTGYCGTPFSGAIICDFENRKESIIKKIPF